MAKKLGMKKKQNIQNFFIHILLAILSIIWIIPIAYIVYISFRPETSTGALSLIPANFKSLSFAEYMHFLFGRLTINNYITLFNDPVAPYLKWFTNTLCVALVVMLINTFFILSVAYTMSRLKFKGRKTLMSINLVLGMFPGFMSMIAIYNILKLVNLTGSLVGLTLCYSMSSGMGFYVAKGFFDTVPKSLDEAARIDGASNAKIFYKIVIPLAKPIIVYTLVTAFMGPWMDYIFCSLVLRNAVNEYTVALGLYKMIGAETINYKFTQFFAGSVLISIPIMSVFLATQKYYVAGVTGGAVKG